MVKLLGKNSARQSWELPDRTEALQEDREGVSMPARSLFVFSSRGSSRKQLLAKSKTEDSAWPSMICLPTHVSGQREYQKPPNWWKGKEFRKDGFVNFSVFSPPFREVISDLLYWQRGGTPCFKQDGVANKKSQSLQVNFSVIGAKEMKRVLNERLNCYPGGSRKISKVFRS